MRINDAKRFLGDHNNRINLDLGLGGLASLFAIGFFGLAYMERRAEIMREGAEARETLRRIFNES